LDDIQITHEQLVTKFSELYPREFTHTLSEVRGDILQARVNELEAKMREDE
jgi:hypothetical protein